MAGKKPSAERKNPKTSKQQRRAKGLTILKRSHPRMRALRRAGHVAEIHGDKLWDSSFLIMKLLGKRPLKRRAKVLEIGCGWGLLGLWCNREFGARVHGIDADANVLPYAELHAEVNGLQMSTAKKRFDQLTVKFLSDFDVIVGADICFWDEMTDELFKLIRRARKAGVEQVMIADPCRPPFTALVERCEARMPGVECVDLSLKKPVATWGQVLVVDNR